MTRKSAILFFDVDDIAVAFRKKQRREVMKMMEQIKGKYLLAGGNDLTLAPRDRGDQGP